MQKATSNKRLLLSYLVLCAVSLLAAAAHRMQLGDLAAYTSSWLIPIEFTMVILLLLSCVLLPIYMLITAIRRRWNRLGVACAAFFLVLISLFLTLLIDAPTLVYAT